MFLFTLYDGSVKDWMMAHALGFLDVSVCNGNQLYYDGSMSRGVSDGARS